MSSPTSDPRPTGAGAPAGSPAELRFRWPWRPYQARLLRSVDDHLGDDRLHVVAAPGAGKTTLGLEIVRRLGHPALVLAPTLAIRDQWVARLRDFLPEGGRRRIPSWVSRDLRTPGHLTVTTYQAVLARHRADGSVGAGEPRDETLEEADPTGDEAIEVEAPPEAADVDTLVSILRELRLGTLVLDEAHHLRQEWWRSLAEIVDRIPDLTLVSLTATPPYDSSGREWLRYEQLCGPIDDEISVPELVRAGTLAPHQDFVHLVSPTPEEARSAVAHDRKVVELLDTLAWDQDFLGQILDHPWVSDPDADAVLGEPELAVSLLVYLMGTGAPLPLGLLGLLEFERTDLPQPSRRWWQVLLHEYLFGRSFSRHSKAYRDELATRLRKEGLLWRRELRIEASRPVARSLALSAAKVSACLEIFRAEDALRGERLRQVVLTDFIRDEGWAAGPGALPTELGALPVFDRLVTGIEGDAASAVAMVTGRLCVLHESREEAFRAALGSGVPFEAHPAPHRPGWLRIGGPSGSRLVGAFTRLLTQGRLRVLVGTRSLLGEGWDAPCVSSVVLASYVGSFVSTNQMRGRGIRTDPDDPGKVASIWHVAALQPDTPAGVIDLQQLQERFRTFVGISADGRVIESGFERLQLASVRSSLGIRRFNEENLARHRALPDLFASWSEAVHGGDAGRVAPTLQASRAPRMAPYYARRTLRSVLYEAGWAALAAVGWHMVGITSVDGVRTLGAFVATLATGGFLAMLPGLVRALRLTIRHLPVDGTIHRMGEALLEAMICADLVEGSDRLRVHSEVTTDGGVAVSLEGGTFYEQTLFADAMGELLGPIENPRYIITRESERWRAVRDTALVAGRDYHAVPIPLGVNKDRAAGLLEAWHRHVGPGELVFTRREGGRRLLLAARARSFSTSFDGRGCSRLDRWS